MRVCARTCCRWIEAQWGEAITQSQSQSSPSRQDGQQQPQQYRTTNLHANNTDTPPAEQDQQLRAQVELLRNPDAGSPSHSPEGTKREPVNETGSPDAAAGTNAFDQHHQQPAPGPGAAPIESAGSHQRPEAESFIHPDLRAAHASHVAAAQQAAGMMPMDPPTGHSPQSSTNTNQSPPPPPNSNNPGASLHNTANPPPQQTHNANLAPAPPPQGQPQPPQQPQHVQHHPGAAGLQDPVSPDGRARPKRELSQSKRAAQNRAAQVRLALPPFPCHLAIELGHD